jgi:hypothetical protein
MGMGGAGAVDDPALVADQAAIARAERDWGMVFVTGDRQMAMLQASREIDEGLGIKSHDLSAIGAWSDGAENSVMTITRGATFDQLKAAAAMKGALARQRAVLVCHENADAPGLLYHFAAKGPLADIHTKLLEAGLSFHTLVPAGDGAAVYVADPDGTVETFEAVRKAAARYNAEVTYHHCEAEFIGASPDTPNDRQRDEAQQAYRRAIGGSGIQGSGPLWARVHAAYGTALADARTGLKASGSAEAARQNADWAAASPITDVDHLMALAKGNQQRLGDAGREIAKEAGVTFIDPGPKTNRQRIVEKTASKPGRTAASISDTSRGGFVLSAPEQGDQIVQALAKRFEVADEGWARTPEGYVDRKVVVRFADGQLGEIQMWEPHVLDAKERRGGHALYEQMRALPPGSPELPGLLAKQRELYGRSVEEAAPAWGAFFARSAPAAS